MGRRTLDLGALRSLRIEREGRFRSSGEAFRYQVRLLELADLDRLMELHEEIMDSLPDPLLLYRRNEDFFRECIEDGCVTGAEHGTRLMAYAALYVPGLEGTNYGRDIGLTGDDLLAVGHLAGSAVAPRYRGNRMQRKLVDLRNRFAVRSGHHHLCGEVVPTNVISIINHLATDFFLKGHRIDDFGDRCFVLHSDLRREPERVEGEEVVEVPIGDLERYVELVERGRWGFEVVERDDGYRIRFARFE